MKLKLGRNEVKLVRGDYIMDNGSCLQVTCKDTSAQIWRGWHASNPYLSKKEFKRFLKEAKYKVVNKGTQITYYNYIGDKECG